MLSEGSYGPYSGPANVSRLHEATGKAREATLGKLLFRQNRETKVITNSLFDSSLIHYDFSYCTTVSDTTGKHRISTLNYFNRILSHLDSEPLIIDVGCGQGEFVQELRQRGFSASGFDPVLRKSSHFLFDRLWTEKETPGDLYVMRCVLPHIEHPWEFLESIWSANQDALVLVEYQSWSWISRNSVWNQICHDHVHQFRLRDFLKRNLVVDSGVFEEGEWEWVLLARTSPKIHEHRDDIYLEESFEKINSDRETSIRKIVELLHDFSVLTVWGGAAKGSMLAHSLLEQLDLKLKVVDQDPNRIGKYLEGSAVQVESPDELSHLGRENMILSANPRHLDWIKSQIKGRSFVTSITEILRQNV